MIRVWTKFYYVESQIVKENQDSNLFINFCFCLWENQVTVLDLLPESFKTFILPRIQIRASQTFLTSAYYKRQYFDQFDICFDLE